MVNLSPVSLYINSRFATLRNGLTSDIEITLKNQLVVPRNIQIHCRVLNSQIPISYYVCNESNNTLTYTIGGTSYSFNVPIGNYTAKQLASQLNLNSISVSYDGKTNKMSFSASSSFSFESSTTIWELIGFSEGLKSSVSNILISDLVCDTSGPNAVYLHSNLDNTNFDTTGTTSILSKFPQNTAANGILNYSNKQDSNYTILKTRDLNVLNFELRDERGNVINLNGIHWECQLLFSFHYVDVYDKTKAIDTTANGNIFQGNNDFIYTHEIKKQEEKVIN